MVGMGAKRGRDGEDKTGRTGTGVKKAETGPKTVQMQSADRNFKTKNEIRRGKSIIEPQKSLIFVNCYN